MRVYALLIYIFLYTPIALIVGLSFNAGKQSMVWKGFSAEWYGKAFNNPLIMEALGTSLIIALATAVLSAVFGTMLALGVERLRSFAKSVFEALIYTAILVPGIVIGISSLITFVTIFDLVNPLFNIRLQMGIWSVIATHVLFNIAVVGLLVRARLQGMDRSLVEAAEDLYATPLGTLRQVVLPMLAPAILAGALLAFTFSFEDFIIAFFVAGPDITLPIYVFSAIRRGVTPEINAVSTVVLLSSLALFLVAQWVLQRKPQR
jgi:spermidine/putrescine transport system permease protein